MILEKIFLTSTTPLLLTALCCTALRIDYPRNEISINHQQTFNPQRPSTRPQNTFKQQVEIVGKFNSGSGKRFPNPENGQMGFRSTPSYPHRFGGANMENNFPTFSTKTPSLPTDFGISPHNTPTFPVNFGVGSLRAPSFSIIYGGGSAKTPSFPMNYRGGTQKTQSFPVNFEVGLPKNAGFPLNFSGNSAKSPNFPTNFGSTNGFPTKTPGYHSNFGDAHNISPKSPSFHPLSSDPHQFSPSPPLNFRDDSSFLPKTPTSFPLDSDKKDYSPMGHSKFSEDLRSRLQFTPSSNFGRQNRRPIGEGNVRNNLKTEQKSYKDIFGKSFEDSRKTNPFSSGVSSDGGKSMGEDVFSGYPETENGDFSSGLSGDDEFVSDDFNSKFVGEVDDAAKYDGNNHKKYEKNYASGYFHNAHTYYKLFE